jgi:NAD(P)-dependent dehydrogenase (short-subunit alcohol dehydrogenase family)
MIDPGLAGCTALVTGGGTGIGHATALRLLEQGTIVTIAGRRSDVLEESARRLRARVAGAEVRVQQCDITVETDVERAVQVAAGAGGRLDIAVANAGTGVPGPILSLSADHWRYACDLNIMGTALTIKHAALAMQQHGGSIVAISSGAGFKIPKFMATYGATKAGLEMLVRCAAIELAPFAIRVNTIRPGFIPTEGALLGFSEDEQKIAIEHTPLARNGFPRGYRRRGAPSLFKTGRLGDGPDRIGRRRPRSAGRRKLRGPVPARVRRRADGSRHRRRSTQRMMQGGQRERRTTIRSGAIDGGRRAAHRTFGLG